MNHRAPVNQFRTFMTKSTRNDEDWVRVNFIVPPWMKEAVEKEAERRMCPASVVYRQLLEKGLKKEEAA